MPRKYCFLDRLIGVGDEDSTRTIGSDSAAIIASIVDNLDRILGSRQGSAMAQPDYGLPDLDTMRRNMPATEGRIEDAIAEAIEKFEPRLVDVRVTRTGQDDEEPDAFKLNFGITAYLVNPRKRHHFEAFIEGSGKVNVTSD